MDLKEIAEAYQLVYEKKKLDPVGKEDDDVDNDGDSDSSDEYLKKRRAAIGKAMGKDDDKEDDDDKDDDNEDSKGLSKGQKKLPPQLQKAIAKKGKKSDKKESLDLMSAYHSMYEHHQKDADGNVIPHEDEEEVKEGIDLSFVDELSEEELDTLVEEVVYDLLDEGIELDAIEGAFTQYLEEATVTFGHDTPGAPKKPDSKQYDKPVKIKDSDEQMSSDLKKRKEEKAKASKEKAEKFKKAVGKVVDRIKSKPTRVSRGLKAKAHSKLADYAGSRKLMPTKAAAAAEKPKKPYMSKKYKQDPQGETKFRDAKTKYVGDKAKYEKVKDKKQSTTNIKMSMRGSGAKDARSKLRSAVFKDVKDRVGKKVSSTIQKGRNKVADGIVKARDKTSNVLDKIASKVRGEGRELDMFDTVTAYLIDEGLARDFDHAQRVMITLDSALIEEVHAEQMQFLESSMSAGSSGGHYSDGGDGVFRSKQQVANMFNKNIPTKKQTGGKVDKMTRKSINTSARDFGIQGPTTTKESLEDAYLKVYEGKDTSEMKNYLDAKAKKLEADKKKQSAPYKNNPAFGDESHHSNAKNK